MLTEKELKEFWKAAFLRAISNDNGLVVNNKGITAVRYAEAVADEALFQLNERFEDATVQTIEPDEDTSVADHECRYSKSLGQEYPRKCIICGEPEPIHENGS